ncbi:MAG: DedA family protein [Parachlamydiales bacterium]|jgi:LPXTG-motif cell wall-anchored protein
MTTLFIVWLFSHALYAHYFIFGALLLSGLNIPFSEDLLIIGSALLASVIVPQNVYLIYLWVFLGCFFSDPLSYFLGRIMGVKLLKYKWFKKTLPDARLKKVTSFLQKYGFWTFLVGRFVPFGIRNCLFLTAGIGKMPFSRFALTDLFASLLSSSSLFFLAYTFGKSYQALIYHFLETFHLVVFGLLLVGLSLGFWLYKKRKKNAEKAPLSN